MAGKRTAERRASSGMLPAARVEPPVAEVTGASAALVLPADCRIGAQAALRQALLDALETGGVVLDGRAVERTDTAALQLLTLFQREVQARGKSLSWCGASDALNEAAALLGLAQILELPAAALA